MNKQNLEFLENQIELLAKNIVGWEQYVLQTIARRIGKYGKLSVSDLKSINNMLIVKNDFKDFQKKLSRLTGYNISQIQKMFDRVIAEHHLEHKYLYDYRNFDFIPFEKNLELQAIAKAYSTATAKTMLNLAKANAMYIVNSHGQKIHLRNYYIKALDKAVIQVKTGAVDFHSAMRHTIIEMGGSGLKVAYNGTNRSIESAVRQNLLWGVKQATFEYDTLIGEELNCDGIEIDGHMYPRPSHNFMNGRQFSLSGRKTIKGKTYESADEALKRLEDYGCKHFKTSIILGVSEPTYDRKQLKKLDEQNKKTFEVNGKKMTGYEVSQSMRKCERNIRNNKNIKKLAEAEGDTFLKNKCQKNIKKFQNEYEKLSNASGIQKEPKRTNIVREVKKRS